MSRRWVRAARAVIRVAGTDRYPVPAAEHQVEEVIRRSRFITTVGRAGSAQDAERFIARVREKYDDATHNCWAYAAGPPGSTTQVGMSDAGEPHGTAGRPMLEALLHSGLGEIVAVVTRYYGGVKLGKGGLQRAYSGGAKLALETVPRAERVTRSTLSVELEYSALDAVRRVATELDVAIVGEEYTDVVQLEVGVPIARVAEFRSRVADITSGGADVEAS